MIASTQVLSTKIFTFITVLIFKLLSPKVLFISKKDNRNCFFKKIANFASKLLQNYK